MPLDYQQVLKDYKVFRARSKALNSKLSKLIPRSDFHKTARALGMLGANNTLVFDNVDEPSILMEYGIYAALDHHEALIDRVCRNPPSSFSPSEIELLGAFSRSRYSIWETREAVPGVGVHTTDLLFHGPDRDVFIADISFSQGAGPEMLLAGRILSCGGFHASTGAAYGVSRRRLSSLLHIADMFAQSQDVRPGDSLTREQETILCTQLIRYILGKPADLHAGLGRNDVDPVALLGSGSVESAERPRSVADGLSRGTAKISRNSFCPCGSGLKYKKCCGRAALGGE
ncbi:MAG: SEC-C metal-binding domain-containing protein [Candidatus Sumerlaeota bacterium]|nr:SEC-C metal-binding domain-containing protein [Candidatus Sumerlaeota bacterium]